jgi:hypothetical protein
MRDVSISVPRVTVHIAVVAVVVAMTMTVGTNASRADAQSINATVVSRLPVVQCPTRTGGDYGSRVRLPATLPERVDTKLVGKVALYADQYDAVRLVGPKGWSCVASLAVDGGAGLQFYPSGTASPGFFTSMTGRSSATGLTVQQEPACYACRLSLACPFFAAARKLIEQTYGSTNMLASCTRPAGEVVTSSTPSTRFFTDAPHVAGHAYPSGGADRALGVAYFGAKTFSYLVSCTLASSQRETCRGALNWFVAHHRSI